MIRADTIRHFTDRGKALRVPAFTSLARACRDGHREPCRCFFETWRFGG